MAESDHVRRLVALGAQRRRPGRARAGRRGAGGLRRRRRRSRARGEPPAPRVDRLGRRVATSRAGALRTADRRAGRARRRQCRARRPFSPTRRHPRPAMGRPGRGHRRPGRRPAHRLDRRRRPARAPAAVRPPGPGAGHAGRVAAGRPAADDPAAAWRWCWRAAAGWSGRRRSGAGQGARPARPGRVDHVRGRGRCVHGQGPGVDGPALHRRRRPLGRDGQRRAALERPIARRRPVRRHQVRPAAPRRRALQVPSGVGRGARSGHGRRVRSRPRRHRADVHLLARAGADRTARRGDGPPDPAPGRAVAGSAPRSCSPSRIASTSAWRRSTPPSATPHGPSGPSRCSRCWRRGTTPSTTS